MGEPKRHHWWPELQSRHWAGQDGSIHVVRHDGSFFRAKPENIGVEGQLYTRYLLTGEKDLSIEKWFSSEIESPFRAILDHLGDLPDIRRERFSPDQAKLRTARELGFVVGNWREYVEFDDSLRIGVASYLAALLVRNPRYLQKMREFHATENGALIHAETRNSGFDSSIKTIALNNMLSVYATYRDAIARSEFILIRSGGDKEFLFSDAGIVAKEPWRSGPIPFDIHAPLTPKLAIEVLPVRARQPGRRVYVSTVNAQGVSRMNRISVGHAERFVMSRSAPPIDFIRKNFGKPAPESIGIQYIGGKLETVHDRKRE